MKKQLTGLKMLSLLIVTMLSLVGMFNLSAQGTQSGIITDYKQSTVPESSLKSAMAVADVSPTDKSILMELYNSTNGSGWTNRTNWGTAEPVSNWYGITVVSDQITEIKLKNNNVTGTIPANLGQLLSLQYLDLDTNRLSGVIPVEIGGLSNLEYLYLNGNQLTGTIPSELGQLPNLLLLYLNDNQLTGPIPVELRLLGNLKWLNLKRNLLSGTIPVELAQLSNLEYLELGYNQLTGSIPVELSLLQNLKWLVLNSNNLTGNIPAELGQLSVTGLAQMYLDDNQLTGSIPVELGNLKGLNWLNLGQNQLAGSIPSVLGSLPNLSLLYLDNNLLDSGIPDELGDISGLEWLNIGGNQLTGNIPAKIWTLTNLKLLYLNSNQLTGAIPNGINLMTELKYIDFDSNQLDEIPDLSALVNLTDLTISNNNFTFEDLEYNMDLIPGVNFVYLPQDSIGESLEYTKNAGESFNYTLMTGGNQNNYQWYRNGEILDSQTSEILNIPSLLSVDGGKYYCKVTNTLVGGLTLTSKKITLKVVDSIVLSLTAGWNIFSSTVMPNDSNLKNILQPLITTGVLKKVMDERGKVIEDYGASNGGWQNFIGNMKSTEGYKINVAEDVNLPIVGIATQFPFDIKLTAGWNIISWPSANEQNGKDVFQTLIDDGKLKKVMDKTGNVIEDYGASNGGWQNFIINLKPGEGYKVNVTEDCTLTITESGTKSSVITPEIVNAVHFQPSYQGHGVDHMNINLVNLSGSGIMVDDEIGIFDGSTCVGAFKVTGQNSSFINLIASADDTGSKMNDGFIQGNDIQLKLFRNGKEYPLKVIPVNSTSLQFEKNGTIFAEVSSDLNTGIVLQEGKFSVEFYPNPFNTTMNIDVKLLQREELTVEVYDLLSRRVIQLHSGKAEGNIKLQWDGNDSKGNRVAPGVYICRVNGLLKKVILN